MLKNIFRALSAAVISIILISFLLSGWTSFVLVTDNDKRGEIVNALGGIYESQRSFLVNVIDLSKILLEERLDNQEINTDIRDFEESLNSEVNDLESDVIKEENQNLDNPLSIVITKQEGKENENDKKIGSSNKETNMGSMNMEDMSEGFVYQLEKE